MLKISLFKTGISASSINAASASLLFLNPSVTGHNLHIDLIKSAIALSLSFLIAAINCFISLLLSPSKLSPLLYTRPTITDCSTGCSLNRSGYILLPFLQNQKW